MGHKECINGMKKKKRTEDGGRMKKYLKNTNRTGGEKR
jgi:hypothetical protein